MKLSVQRFKAEGYSADATVLFLPQEKGGFDLLASRIRSTWENTGSALDSGDISGAKDSASVVYTGSKKSPRLILVGVGDTELLTLERFRRAAAIAVQRAIGLKAESIAVILPTNDLPMTDLTQAIVEGLKLGSYSFDKYFTEKKKEHKPLSKILLLSDIDDLRPARSGMAAGEAIANGVNFARDLANAPSNEIYPESLAKEAQTLGRLGTKVTILKKPQIARLGMGGLLAVNQGSLLPPFFIIMEWNGGKKGTPPVVLVGKGITFDSGGISIKPSAGMADMKMDMGGSAAVLGAMRAIAELKLPMNVVGLVPTTENMPSGSAYKPGDVVTFMNGKTAEIDNTDAEGRLILADALTYADRYKPQAVIDLATLTGACVVALGNVATGMMGNNPELNGRIREAGERSYDRVWELPLWVEYEELIKSDIADVKNSGGRGAGTISAGLFLQHFIGDYKWAHLDIAGSGMVPKASGYISKGGTGAGVRLLIDMLRNWTPMK